MSRLDPRRKAAARDFFMLGDSLKIAAEKAGVPYEALRKAAQREHWPSPARINREVAVAANKQVTQTLVNGGIDQRNRYVQKLSGVADKFADTVGEMDTRALLSNARSIETLDRVARRTLRLDDTQLDNQNAINIAILTESEVKIWKPKNANAREVLT